MDRPAFAFLTVVLAAAVVSCNSNKPKPVSDSIAKTAVTVAGKKDSVINNPQRNYGNATIAEPCVKCVIGAIQADSAYQKIAGKANDVKYVINYIESAGPADTTLATKATNALRVDVVGKTGKGKLASFVYDNSSGKLYTVAKQIRTVVKADSNLVKKIRNSCYWGVASGK